MNDEELLLSLIYAYTDITIKHTIEEKRNTEWYKIAEAINKNIYRRKRAKLTPARSKKLLALFDKAKYLDEEYFLEDKDFSSFTVAILLLDTSIREYGHLFSRCKLGHYNTPNIVQELETTESFRELIKTHHRFVTKLIEELK